MPTPYDRRIESWAMAVVGTPLLALAGLVATIPALQTSSLLLPILALAAYVARLLYRMLGLMLAQLHDAHIRLDSPEFAQILLHLGAFGPRGDHANTHILLTVHNGAWRPYLTLSCRQSIDPFTPLPLDAATHRRVLEAIMPHKPNAWGLLAVVGLDTPTQCVVWGPAMTAHERLAFRHTRTPAMPA